MLILDKLWDGQVTLAERPVGRSAEYTLCLREMERAREVLEGDLTPAQQGLLKAFDQQMKALAAYLERDAFFAGCRLGGQMIMDILPGLQ